MIRPNNKTIMRLNKLNNYNMLPWQPYDVIRTITNVRHNYRLKGINYIIMVKRNKLCYNYRLKTIHPLYMSKYDKRILLTFDIKYSTDSSMLLCSAYHQISMPYII